MMRTLMCLAVFERSDSIPSPTQLPARNVIPHHARNSLLATPSPHRQEVSPEMIDKIFQKYDTDKSGEIDKGEIPLVLKKYRAYLQKEKDYLELFIKHDKSQDGKLQLEELMPLLAEIAPPPYKHADEADAEFVLAKADTDGSGAIEMNELRLAIALWLEIAPSVPPAKGSSACVIL